MMGADEARALMRGVVPALHSARNSGVQESENAIRKITPERPALRKESGECAETQTKPQLLTETQPARRNDERILTEHAR
jgi:hypothetical protein